MSHPDTEKPDDHDADATQPRPAGESSFAPASPAAASPFAEYYRPPRLGIIHMLAWMAATAIVLKIDLAISVLYEAGNSRLGLDTSEASQLTVAWIYASWTINSMARGASLVGAAVLLRACYRGIGGKLQPGHWIVLIEVLWFVAWMGRALIQGVLYNFDLWRHPISKRVDLVVFSFIVLCHVGLYLYVAWRNLREKRWRRLFIVVGVLALVQHAPYFVSLLLFRPQWFLPHLLTALARGMALAAVVPHALTALAVGMALAVVVTLDLRARCRRDWIHWLGVAILMMPVLMRVGGWV